MSLTAALTTAQSSLKTVAGQTAVVSRNVAGAGEAGYTRKTALAVTGADGGVRGINVGRATDRALYERVLQASSKAAGGAALAEALERLQSSLGTDYARSPSVALGALQQSLHLFAAAPGDLTLAQGVLSQAETVVTTLHEGSAAAQALRADADAGIAASVDRVNGILSKFQSVNAAIVNGTIAGSDVTALMDTRDGMIAELAAEIGITVVGRGNNDVALYTESGVTLFETVPRTVSFVATHAFGAGTAGNAVYVDGVPVTGDGAMAVRSGRISGLAAVRDEVAVEYQAALDEIARGLIEAFAEADLSAVPTLPDRPGLFTWPGEPAIPAGGAIHAGLAATIVINANADPARGGDLARLRDGGISDPGNPAYVSNVDGGAGFSARIEALVDQMTAARAFDPAAGGGSTTGLLSFASGSIGRLEAARQGASADGAYQTAFLERVSEAFANATGVNLDDEMAEMLRLERSYQASAKLIAAIDAMLAMLLDATG
ncbi:flagellar hook-associated protein FlgK [Faunimonas sp. B44]|uniref:flagellar hook-associated protein FlgK n=1 Tax=Faunimonas sp. B44 TaxID=3461493 RepID=UPI004044447E